MKETRRYAIPRRRFTRTDLFGLAGIFRENFEQSLAPSVGYSPSLSITLHCSGGVTYESDTVQHLEADGEIDRRHVNVVSFSFSDYRQPRRIELQLTNGGGYADELRVSGEGQEWVQATFVSLSERLNAAAPSSSWFTNHPMLTYHLCAIGLGSAVWLVSQAIAEFIYHFVLSPETNAKVRDALNNSKVGAVLLALDVFPVSFILSWISTWMMGIWGQTACGDGFLVRGRRSS